MNLLYLSSHSILEYDQVKLWTDLGYSVFSIGAYTDPSSPSDDKRPAIDAPYFADLADLCHRQRVKHAGESLDYAIDWAKADLAPEVIEWADAIMVDCFPVTWIGGNWDQLKHKRVIWRTIGQSNPDTERVMQGFHRNGMEIVRYSPAEKRAFGPHPWFAGEDAVIRFGKDPADWYGWTGERAVIGNLAQHDSVPHGRDAFLNWGFLEKATEGLPLEFAGPNSEKIGGLGALNYDEMRQYLRTCRAYLYTGTQPASYTLGLIEAMMTGCPVVSIGPERMWMPELFEGREIAFRGGGDPPAVRRTLAGLLEHPDRWGHERQRAIDLFGTETIGRQWLAYLGNPVSVTWQGAEAVTA